MGNFRVSNGNRYVFRKTCWFMENSNHKVLEQSAVRCKTKTMDTMIEVEYIVNHSIQDGEKFNMRYCIGTFRELSNRCNNRIW